MSDTYTDKDIVERLDQLIAIMKLANKSQLDAQKELISKDDMSQAILELLTDGPMDYSTLAEKAAQKSGKSDRIAQSRIADLTDSKILAKKREQGKTLYYNSGILE